MEKSLPTIAIVGDDRDLTGMWQNLFELMRPGLFDFRHMALRASVRADDEAPPQVQIRKLVEEGKGPALVVLHDPSADQGLFESKKYLFYPAATINVEAEVDAYRKASPIPEITVTSPDPYKEGNLNEKVQREIRKIYEDGEQEVRDALTRKKEGATHWLLSNVPDEQGASLVKWLRSGQSPCRDVPLLVMGVLPEREKLFQQIGGDNTHVLSSDSMAFNDFSVQIPLVVEFIENCQGRGK